MLYRLSDAQVRLDSIKAVEKCLHYVNVDQKHGIYEHSFTLWSEKRFKLA